MTPLARDVRDIEEATRDLGRMFILQGTARTKLGDKLMSSVYERMYDLLNRALSAEYDAARLKDENDGLRAQNERMTNIIESHDL
jgi:hypothetical protein